MEGGAGQGWERVFPGQGEQAEQQVEDLEDGDGFDGAVEGFGQEVEEEFGEEEGGEGGCYLVCWVVRRGG